MISRALRDDQNHFALQCIVHVGLLWVKAIDTNGRRISVLPYGRRAAACVLLLRSVCG